MGSSRCGGAARLVPVAERRAALLGNRRSGRSRGTLFDPPDEPGSAGAPEPAATVLDRLHQAMLLFADGRSEALRRHLAEVSADPRFRRLAQALSALYPASSGEKRWLDGVIAVARQVGG